MPIYRTYLIDGAWWVGYRTSSAVCKVAGPFNTEDEAQKWIEGAK